MLPRSEQSMFGFGKAWKVVSPSSESFRSIIDPPFVVCPNCNETQRCEVDEQDLYIAGRMLLEAATGRLTCAYCKKTYPVKGAGLKLIKAFVERKKKEELVGNVDRDQALQADAAKKAAEE